MSEAMRLPDFMFVRVRSVGVTLAGVLVTNIPSHEEMSGDDRQLIFEVVNSLNDEAQRDPDWSKASIWPRGAMPPGGSEELFPDAVRRAQANGCVVVRVWGDGFRRVDDVQLAEIMEWAAPAVRLN